ncbi:MAG: HPr family phosphocarrier protein [Alphaproteobacteria bacterium]|nr:HPr family phosphocarrier protein [Alphaproteobacteria bacterium]
MPTHKIWIDAVVIAQNGLHARPCAALLNCVRDHDAEVWIRYKDDESAADSMLDLLSLCIPEGAIVGLCATGADSGTALDAIVGLGLFSRTDKRP